MGKVSLRLEEKNSEGYVWEEYMKEIEAHEFLDRVEPFFSSEEERQKMIRRTRDIFDSITKKALVKL